MLHTMHFTGIGRSYDEALAMAETVANRTFSAIALLSRQRVSRLSSLLLPDPTPPTRAACLVYVLDVPSGGAEVLDARKAGVEQEVRAALPASFLEQVGLPFRPALSLSSLHKVFLNYGPYKVFAFREPTSMFRVTVQRGTSAPHLSELKGNLDKCEGYLTELGIPLDGWIPEEPGEERQETT